MAGSIRSRSDSEPMRMPTSAPAASNSSMTGSGVGEGTRSGLDMHCLRGGDVGAVLGAGEVDPGNRFVGTVASVSHAGGRARDGENASARAHEPALPQGRAGVE